MKDEKQRSSIEGPSEVSTSDGGITKESLRSIGKAAGLFRVPDDFDAPLPEEILREFEGE